MDFLGRVLASKGSVREMRRLPAQHLPVRSSAMLYAGTWSGELSLTDIMGVVGVRCDHDSLTLYLAITSTTEVTAVYSVDVPASLITRLLIMAVVDAAMCNDTDPRRVWDGSLYVFEKVPRLRAQQSQKLQITKSFQHLSLPRAPYVLF